jgi:hypothetical protein
MVLGLWEALMFNAVKVIVNGRTIAVFSSILWAMAYRSMLLEADPKAVINCDWIYLEHSPF